MIMNKDVITRRLTLSEFEQESEGRNKFFTVKYKERDNIFIHTREYERKTNVRALVENPDNIDVKIYLNEVVDKP